MTDTVRERVCTLIAARLDAARGWRRPDLPARTMVVLPDDGGAPTVYGAQQMGLTVLVEHIEAAPAPTADDEADQLAVERRINALIGEIVAAMGSAELDDGDPLADAPYVTRAGPVQRASDDGTELLGVVVEFATEYRHVLGDPYTPA